jgi:hypothetical protein
MAKRVRKITPSFLKKVIREEARRLRHESVTGGELEPIEKVEAEEVDADEYAGSLEKDLDHIKVLKIQERKLIRTINKIREAKSFLTKRIAKRV